MEIDLFSPLNLHFTGVGKFSPPLFMGPFATVAVTSPEDVSDSHAISAAVIELFVFLPHLPPPPPPTPPPPLPKPNPPPPPPPPNHPPPLLSPLRSSNSRRGVADNIITLSMTFGTGFAYVTAGAKASSQRDNEFTWHMGSLVKGR